MGDARRHLLMAELCATVLDPHMRIADIGAGKGYLQGAMRMNGFIDVESWDKRPRLAKTRQNFKGRYAHFDWTVAPRFDAVVAMHPDEATDHAIMYAGHHRVPAIICPCCTRPSAVPFDRSANMGVWFHHLYKMARGLSLRVRTERLSMDGANTVMILEPTAFDGGAEHG